MKKLTNWLKIFAGLSLVTTPISLVVSCGSTNKPKLDEHVKTFAKMPTQKTQEKT
ncbi:hypothetical protein SCLARK_00189 [Spiroplasma clarkii]|uniref:Lipoprotein n=1 Tax=Spiroplasma clarkii TaxID=2139 RepID=A0A1Y0KZ31_9MOLU|nr:hypothetical protein [Spiroplasma clarkii]ARU90973.1 hypothetical protein SCLARK_00189 [Spiroplasma clarkii]ATX70415.1 hypothetical protein SCLAR_v1c00800 [Spiroplasma clarkii]